MEPLAEALPEPDRSKFGYSSREISKLTGITYRQIDYWIRTQLVGPPSFSPGRGSGTHRRFSPRDLLVFRLIKTMLDAGMSLPNVRHVLKFLNLEELEEGRMVAITSTQQVYLFSTVSDFVAQTKLNESGDWMCIFLV